jgi:hypothetical protein
MKKLCRCGEPIGKHSSRECDYHAGYHAGRTSIEMPKKRAADPAYREDERQKVKVRMRKLRAERRASA